MSDAMMDFDAGPTKAAAKHDAGGKVKLALQPGVIGSARFSDCGRYRYWLMRDWGWRARGVINDGSGGYVLWVGMNPSTAEGDVDDPTIRKEMHFTRAMGLDSYVKANVMDYRATNPKALLASGVMPCSDRNAATIEGLALGAVRIVVAWGALPKLLQRYADRIVTILPRDRLECMGTTKDGAPRHPLYLPNTATPQPWVGP